jgi:predicted nuclease of predicted toxin-antitoxin system
VRILLDENMPRKLVAALVAQGHEVDSVKSLQLQGIDNGALYQLAAANYDLCFTRDAEFSTRVLSKPAPRLKLVHVVIPQTKQDEFV